MAAKDPLLQVLGDVRCGLAVEACTAGVLSDLVVDFEGESEGSAGCLGRDAGLGAGKNGVDKIFDLES